MDMAAEYLSGENSISIESTCLFLNTLFDEQDLILYRPIEIWTEDGRKHSRVDRKNTVYRKATASLTAYTVRQLLESSKQEHTNLFFGICPRLGDKGRYDLAWQVRTVRALWADIDNTTVDEALARVAEAGLPPPTIVVNSGNGVHLYWLLDEPFQIDDVGEPPAVEIEWTQTPLGNRPRKYIVEDGARVYLDQRRHVSRLSAKAEHIQDCLAGIAKAIGGDHTIDLSRLLRLPGTFNRKDERNGRPPLRCVLVECDESRRYSLSSFEHRKSPSPDTERSRKIAIMPLPKPRKPSAATGDKLAELVAASSIAKAGMRSEADFALCCYAIKHGVAKDEVWSLVQNIGKFSERGQRYFDLTWDNAEYEARSATLDKLEAQEPTPQYDSAHRDVEGDVEPPGDSGGSSVGRPTIVVAPETMPVGQTLRQITDRLLAAANCFSRSEQLVVIHGEQLLPILSTPELAGLLNQHVEFYFVNEDGGEYKPLPATYANTWLNQRAERDRLPMITLFTHNPVFSDDWRLVAPGFDVPTGIYFAGQVITPSHRTEHLDNLLRDFCFKTPGDRTNYLSVLVTTLMMPRFIGSKPAVLFNGNQPGLGKSILAQIIAILRDGRNAETASYNSNDEEFEKRLGAIVRGGATTIIIDNAKSSGRNPKIESACLERSITDPILSYRLLGQSASIRAENSHIFCITANTPDVSRDLVTRSVVVNLHHEGDPQRRSFSIADPEGYAQQHRLELLGELIGMVELWKAQGMPLASTHSRFNKRGWGNIVGGILDACGEPDFLANADEAAAELDETRREFTELIGVLVDHPQAIWTAAELVELCGRHRLMSSDLGDGSPRSLSTRMGTLAGRFISERFEVADGRTATFHRTDGRKGKVYQVFVQEEVPNLGAFAEPCRT
jgi:hypothetical protein